MALAQTSPFDPHLQDNVVFGDMYLQCGIVSLCFNKCHTWHFAYLQQDGKFLGLSMLQSPN